ncbi:MAG: hypothetical protein U0670_20400 [Anaerolineae bacterium]
MNVKQRSFGLIAAVVVLGALLTASLNLGFAQTDTPVPQPTRIHSDLRINDLYELNGLGVYCESGSGQAGMSFAGGGIAVWSVGGQRVIFVPESDITGMDDMNADSTAEASAAASTPAPTRTRAANQPFQVVLLATGAAPFGPVMLYQVEENTYLLSGVLSDGKPFVFRWTGCDVGTAALSTDAAYVPPSNVRRLNGATGSATRTGTLTGTPMSGTNTGSTRTSAPQATRTPVSTSTSTGAQSTPNASSTP